MNTSTMGTSQTVINDILEALQDDELSDVCLVGRDGVEIFSNRFVLAARSKVLKSMLYGNFRESTMCRIPFDYDGVILEAIVEFCSRNEIPKFRLYIHRNAHSARRLVQLFKAADYLGLDKLAKVVAQMAHNLTSRYPPLACAVYDESDLDTTVSKDALLMIQCRPYVTLPPDNETEGGIDCLCPMKLLSIYDDKCVKASEMFLFEMLQKWVEICEKPEGKEVAKKCAKHLRLADIEPQDLLGVVKDTGLCTEKHITDAVTTQALRAARSGIWTISSRGRPNIERVIVEGAGSANANGIYYFIDGLANGDLYSKREVACGQQYVYTLSIAAYRDGITECRIFCSPLLTHRSIRSMARTGAVHETSFQPLLQVIDIDILNSGSKYTRLQLSDGDHYMNARIRTTVMNENKIKQNTLIKVLKFGKFETEDDTAIHLKTITVISQDPGYKFGNPVYYLASFCRQDEEDSQGVVDGDVDTIEVQISQDVVGRQSGTEKAPENDQTLQEMYSCRFTADQKPIHSKIPSIGWKVDAHGLEPVPRTRWIPGPIRRPLGERNDGNHLNSFS